MLVLNDNWEWTRRWYLELIIDRAEQKEKKESRGKKVEPENMKKEC